MRSWPSRGRVLRGRSREQFREAVGRPCEVTAGVGRGGGNLWSRSDNRDAFSEGLIVTSGGL